MSANGTGTGSMMGPRVFGQSFKFVLPGIDRSCGPRGDSGAMNAQALKLKTPSPGVGKEAARRILTTDLLSESGTGAADQMF